MSDLTTTEKRVLAVMFVCGRVGRYDFNAACNTDNINKSGRRRAMSSLRSKDLRPYNSMYPGVVLTDG